MRAEIESRGFQTSDQKTAKTFGILELHTILKSAGLLQNKHVPSAYLRGSIDQRRDLLNGLVDTDGHVAPDGQVEFCATNRRLADAAMELVASLGGKASLIEGRSTLNGVDHGPKWRVMFYLDGAAKMPRKASRCRSGRNVAYRYVEVRPSERADTVCIEVDSPDHLFLCGRSMLPTHNSETTSFWTPAWFLENWPDRRVILCSYEADFAASWGRRVRNLISEHPEWFTVRIADDSSAAERWHTTAGGAMATAGIGGPITGKGGDLLILDDPIKNSEQANSSTYRDRAWEWWGSTFLTRREPGASVVMVLTRWHDDDLAGRVLRTSPQGWEVIRLPAIAGETDDLGRKPGVALWPERYNEADLTRIRREVGDYVWQALYQQTPPNLEGGSVYYAFGPENVSDTLQLTNALPIQFTVDFNINPGCHALLGQYDPTTDTMTDVHEFHKASLNAEALIEWLAQWVKDTGGFRWPHIEVFGDASGEGRFSSDGESAWDKVRTIFKRLQWNVRYRIDARNPPVADRVQTVNNALRDAENRRRYLIHPRCERLIADLTAMKWDGNELNKRDRKLSHASDAAGYRIFRVMPLRKVERRTSNYATI